MVVSDAVSPGISDSVADASLSPRLAVKLLGRLEVIRDGLILDARAFGGAKPQQILKILLLQLGSPVSKNRLIHLLWGDEPPAAAMTTLESYVCILRRNLQPGCGRHGVLRTSTGGYWIDASCVDVDVLRFRSLAARSHYAGPREALRLLREALSLASEPLLGDEALSPWAEEERDLHAAQVAEAKMRAAELAILLGLTEPALTWAEELIRTDELNERAWLCLLNALEQAGRHFEGLHQYERCRKVMDRELGCAPGPALRDAYGRLLLAAVETQGDLTDVLSALLLLHQRLTNTATPIAGSGPHPTPGEDSPSVRQAGNVLSSFLRQATVAARRQSPQKPAGHRVSTTLLAHR